MHRPTLSYLEPGKMLLSFLYIIPGFIYFLPTKQARDLVLT